ncbi:MAG: 50S ribosomal protein L29 [Epsilonproteobacteria bacterium]|nr:MAG: 50S ribosomal protein L29 [Campylobacterota bacterium]RLA66508.1 MAG: 50S ribosomal protein L29 [Campylobacterota bacterium]
MLKVEEIKKLDNAALDRKISDFRVELWGYKMQMGTSGIEKPHLIKIAKKNIARLLTEKTFRKVRK